MVEVTLVVKLGGSVITEKNRRETVAEGPLEAAATALGAATEPLVVIHGGGSFGHPNAADHGVTTAEGTRDPAAVEAIHGAMIRLNDRVVATLRDAGLAPVPVQPLSLASRNRGGDLALPGRALQRALAEGFVPVLHGDLVVHAGAGTTVVSGDELVPAVASAVDADRVGLCSDVPGVLDGAGDVVDRIGSAGEIPEAVGDSESTDVSGGMAGKIHQLLAMEGGAQVFGPGGLGAFVAGERPGTRVGGE